YDRVFVAGQAAVDRHHKALLDFDDRKLVRVGRPQLDVQRISELSSSTARTVMYAPTWEGENEPNNYTSGDRFGPKIVETILGFENTRLVYKPHPRVETSKDSDVLAANGLIHELINRANESIADEELQHQIMMQGEVLAMFSAVDALITDVSSVGLDFLYLRPDRPVSLTDRSNNPVAPTCAAPISRATPIIADSTAPTLTSFLTVARTHDTSAEIRDQLRTYYFGAGDTGTSTRRFVQEITSLID